MTTSTADGIYVLSDGIPVTVWVSSRREEGQVTTSTADGNGIPVTVWVSSLPLPE